MSEQQTPYKALGKHLKYMREQSRQSLGEVSDAIEIDERLLAKIESGLERPDEDVLMLLISHFGVKDREAVQLWEMGEYDSDIPEEIHFAEPLSQSKPAIMLLAIDVRTIYSDGLDVLVNPSGVTMHFTQSVGPKQVAPVAKVGMSIEQARQVLATLETALLKSKYIGHKKLLPPASSSL